ncbi:MAG: winged helix-turn-helix domain-containing protein, partial [Pontibacterium sp.]
KPANPRELLARVKAVLRRSKNDTQPTLGRFPATTIMAGSLSLNPGTREVLCNDAPVVLTGTEFNVLAYLMQSAGNVVSKDQLTEWVLHRKLSPYDRSIDVHVSRVRHKLGLVLDGVEVIKTVRGVGYQFIRYDQ